MKERIRMREQSASERIKNFNEVALGYNEKEVIEEASRCLQCKHAPCKKGCPAQVDIPEFIEKVKEGHFDKALEILKRKNNLPAVCGRVCPQESQCEEKCVLSAKDNPVAIGRIERFVADYGIKNNIENIKKEEEKNIKIAVIGAGPAGITCSADLAKKGYDVHLFEGLHIPGGVLVYGIPEFRLPKNIVRSEIDSIKKLGVKVFTDALFGKNIKFSDLKERGFKAVFIASGAGLPNYMGIKGEELNTCYSANEFLTRINLMKGYRFPEFKTPVYTGEKTVVVGGGNVAMDAARCAKRLGADVSVIYRRTEAEMPARLEEIHHAKEEGVDFKFLCNPVEYLGDEKGNIISVKVEKMELGEPDSSGRRRPVSTGEFFDIAANSVVVAIGNKPNPLVPEHLSELNMSKWGTIEVDDNYSTNIKGIFAGGDIATGAATVILAIGAGKKAAEGIDEFIKNGNSI